MLINPELHEQNIWLPVVIIIIIIIIIIINR